MTAHALLFGADHDGLSELLELRTCPSGRRSPFAYSMLGELDAILGHWPRARLIELLDRTWNIGPASSFELVGLKGASLSELRVTAAAIVGDDWSPSRDGEAVDGGRGRIHARICVGDALDEVAA